jgi:hypothetical protein
VTSLVAACAPRVVATTKSSLPATTQLGLLRLPRVWVAGFVNRGQADFDISAETVRILRRHLEASAPAGVVDRGTVALTSEDVFADQAYWLRLAEERGFPLIVTGTVNLLVAPPVPVQRGRRTVYLHATGRSLAATVVLIDGRTGLVVATRGLPQRMQYGGSRAASPLNLFHGLMDQTRPDWLMAIATPASP